MWAMYMAAQQHAGQDRPRNSSPFIESVVDEESLVDVLVHADGTAFGRLDRAGIDGLIVSSAKSVNFAAQVVVCPDRLNVLVDLPREPSGFVARCLIE